MQINVGANLSHSVDLTGLQGVAQIFQKAIQ